MKLKEVISKLEEELIYEMSTLSPKDHNFGIDIKLHILQPGDKQLSHGPRIKCFKPNSNKDFSISLNEDQDKMVLVGSYEGIISTKEFNKLFEMIKFYRIPFLNMWYDPYMSFHELKNEMAQIDRGFTVNLKRKDLKDNY